MITNEQKRNLARTTAFMLTSPYVLDMTGFHSVDMQKVAPKEAYTEGVSCCLAGHGPEALDNRLNGPEDWLDYADRTFGGDDDMFMFLFVEEDSADTKIEIAAKVLAFLENDTLPAQYGSTRLPKFHQGQTVEELLEALDHYQ